jgi:hypothetical protein
MTPRPGHDEPVLDYAPPAKRRKLSTCDVILRLLGCGAAMYLTGRFLEWLLVDYLPVW